MTLPKVPAIPPIPSRAEVLSGRPVRGRTWSTCAEAYNFAIGQGRTIVPIHTPNVSITGPGTATLTYKSWPGIHELKRIWVAQLSSGSWTFAAPSGGADLATVSVYGVTGQESPIVIEQTLSAPESGEVDVDIDVTYNSGGTGTIRSIGCFALPRALLEGGTTANANTEFGVLAASMTPQEQVYYDSANPANSLGGIVNTSLAAVDHITRGGMFSYFAGSDAQALQIAAAGPVTLLAVPPIFLGVKKRRSDTVSELIARIEAKASDGSTAGTVTFTASSGDSVVITVAAGTTSYTWLPGSGGAFDVHAEDLSSADGRRSSSWDTVAVTGARTAGAGTIYVRSVCVGHESP
jgi:hypothetical protein